MNYFEYRGNTLFCDDLSIEDIARVGWEVVQMLGIEQLHTVIGPSMGGMSALSFAVDFPKAVQNLIVISSTIHASPFAIAIRSLQRDIIRSDPAWKSGNYNIE